MPPDPPARKRVVVMQPYFFPYAGYFRLFARADEVLLFDCVQFPRRGRVHRAQVPDAAGAETWLTLPLAHQPQTTLIRDLRFAPDASTRFAERLARLPWFTAATGPLAETLRAHFARLDGPVTEFLQTGLALVHTALALRAPMRRTSSLGLDPALRGQARVIAAARAVGATHYLNAPGGRGLYNDADFKAAGLVLEFLAPYTGPHQHLLPALMSGKLAELRQDIHPPT